MKFSIIIPVYNVEAYISKCLDSIKNQSYDNYEVIIVNDGTKDNSVNVIDKYLSDNRFKLYNKENGGLSSARNYGIKYVTGDYILFIDSDDYIERDLLNNFNNILKNKEYDLVKYNIKVVDDNYNLIRMENGLDKSKEIDMYSLLGLEFSEPAWAYLYKASFFIDNNFLYPVGRIHEDFGLTPLIILKASNIYYLNYYGYNYVQRGNSIVNGGEKNLKRCNDMLFHFDNLYSIISKDEKISNDYKKYMYSYLANGVILKGSLLDKEDLNNYIKELKKRDIFSYLIDDSLKRKLKKFFIKLFPKLYIKTR